jgi:hypothetical protein
VEQCLPNGRDRLYHATACLLGLLHLLVHPLQIRAEHSQAYIDQLIDTDGVEEYADPDYEALMQQPPGRRTFNAEYVNYLEDRDMLGMYRENGLQLLWRRETLDYGELEADAAILDVSGSRRGDYDSTTGGRFTLRQHDFALNSNWIMQNSLGVDRAAADSTLTNSYRIKLPSSLLTGVNSTVSSETTDLQITAGRLGFLDSGQIQTFDETSGNLLMAGVSKDISTQLRAGMQLAHVDDVLNMPDHQSVAGALQYRDAAGEQIYQGHFLADSEGATGVWLDADTLHGRWRQRYGVFRIEPDVLWTDTAMTNDQQGFYARSELRLLRYQLSGGIDFTATDINQDPALNGINSTSLYLNGNRALNRLTSVGSTLNVRALQSEDNTTASDLRDNRLSLFMAHNFPIGTSRLQMEVADIRNGASHGQGGGVTWDQSWDFDSRLRLSSTLGYEAESDTGNDENRLSVGLLAYHDFSNTLRWDANISWTRIHDDLTGSDNDSVNGSLALMWQFQPAWQATLRALANDVSEETAGQITGSEFSERERSLLLTVRYTRSGGRPYERYGRDTGKTGYGAVTGEVFFDENRDGVRQAGESAAAGVYVYLDRRYQQVTDRDGRFVFDPVLTGDHSLSIAQEDLPLPWGLDDERPKAVQIAVRERRFIQIPLVRSDE